MSENDSEISNSKEFFTLSKRYFEKSKYEKSLEYLLKSLKGNSAVILGKDVEFILDLIVKLVDLNRYEDIIHLSKQLLEFKEILNEWIPAIKSSLGIAYRNKGEYEQAIKIFTNLANNNPNNPNVLYLLGSSYEVKGEFKKALDQYKVALKIDPRYLEALQSTREILHDLENYSELERICNKILQISNNDIFALNSLAIIAIRRENYNRAIRLLNTVIEIDNKFLYAWLNLGIAYRETESYKKAIEAFNIIIDIDPTYIEAWKLLANTYFLNENFQYSLEIYEILLKKDGKKFEYFFGISLSHFYLSNFKDAREFIEKALDMNPDSENAQYLKKKLEDLLKDK